MANPSDPRFRVFHALRIKGFAKSDVLGDIADLDLDDVEALLSGLRDEGLATFREARALWQLTPEGRSRHAVELAADVDSAVRAGLAEHYPSFLGLNTQFKMLCGEWQLRDGSPNDHHDADYDRAVIARLVELDGAVQSSVRSMAAVLDRLDTYGPRLARACQQVVEGEINMFTGVMCGSYHDVWMELHEDLILSQGIDRAAEGSF
jgi:hypothetical protein